MNKKVYFIFNYCKNYLYLESLIKDMIKSNINKDYKFKENVFGICPKKIFDKRLDEFLNLLNTPFITLILDELKDKNKILYFLFNIYKDNFMLLEKGIYYFDSSKIIGFNKDYFFYGENVLSFNDSDNIKNKILDDEVIIDDNLELLKNIREINYE